MASDRNIIESAFLRARAKFLVLVEDVDRLWEAGDGEAALSFLDDKLNSLPDSTKQSSMATNPEVWAGIQDRMAQRQKGKTNAN